MINKTIMNQVALLSLSATMCNLNLVFLLSELGGASILHWMSLEGTSLEAVLLQYHSLLCSRSHLVGAFSVVLAMEAVPVLGFLVPRAKLLVEPLQNI